MFSAPLQRKRKREKDTGMSQKRAKTELKQIRWVELLPEELTVYILGFVPVWMQGVCRLVCSQWTRCIQDHWALSPYSPARLLNTTIHTKNVRLFRWFVEHKDHHNYVHKFREDILRKCAFMGAAEMVEVVLNSDKQNSLCSSGVIDAAARGGDLSTLKLVTKHEASPISTDTIYEAYVGGSLACIQYLKDINQAAALYDLDAALTKAAAHRQEFELFDPEVAMKAAARGGHRFLIELLQSQYKIEAGVPVWESAARSGKFELCKWLWPAVKDACNTDFLMSVILGGNYALAQWYFFKREKQGQPLKLSSVGWTAVYNHLIPQRDFDMLNLLHLNGMHCPAQPRHVFYAIQGDAHDAAMLEWLFNFAKNPDSGPMTAIWEYEACWNRAVSLGSLAALMWIMGRPGIKESIRKHPTWLRAHNCTEAVQEARRRNHRLVLEYLQKADWFTADPYSSQFSPS